MKIYGHFLSAPANHVRLAASALGVDHEYVHVDLLAGENKSPAFLAVNPFGKVPALEDDGYTLSESCTIGRYLATREKSDLYPDEPKARGEVDQWSDFAAHHIRTNMAKVLFNKVFAPTMGREPNTASMEEGRNFLSQQVPHVEARLADRDYLCADRLTLADIAMLAAMEPFDLIEFDLAPYPNVKAWRERLMANDWYKRVHNHYAEEMQAA